MIDTSFRAHDSFDSGSSPVYAFFNGELVTKNQSVQPLVFDEFEGYPLSETLYVGEYAGQAYYTVDLRTLPEGFEATRLWDLLNVESFHFDLAGRALQLINWNKTHQFCGVCGSKTMQGKAEWNRTCSDCGQRFYPRLAPCVIMAIRKGEKILLAQRPGAKHNLYTVLAGFVEPGESAEQCVMREVAEEIGIQVKNIRYFSSQPWPFPGQLMLGFIADYASGELDPDLTEVQNPTWFDYQDLPEHPSTNTISGRLIKQTVAEVANDLVVES